MSRINFKLSWVEHEKSVITSGSGRKHCKQIFLQWGTCYSIIFYICFSVPEFINLETSKIVFENDYKPRRKSLVSARSEGDSPRNGHVTFLPPLISTSGVGSDLETETRITNGKSRNQTYKVDSILQLDGFVVEILIELKMQIKLLTVKTQIRLLL